MKTIYKFEIAASLKVITDDEIHVSMQAGAEILSVANQNEVPCIWAKVDTDRPMVKRHIQIRGTGVPLKGNEGKFVGTAQFMDGGFVLHVFDTDEETA